MWPWIPRLPETDPTSTTRPPPRLSIGTTAARDSASAEAADLEPTLEHQLAAMEHLENAIHLLEPPSQQPQDEQEQQQQPEEQISQRQAERRLQEIREREAERQRRREQQRTERDPVEKDW